MKTPTKTQGENPGGKSQEKPAMKMPGENARKNPGAVAGLSWEPRRPHGVVDVK